MKQIKKQIITNSTPDETRIAILENDSMTEFFVDRTRHEKAQVVGNIYQGKVENVLPGISSAFVDVGQEKNAYLYITDVLSDTPSHDIDKMLKKGSNILIQVAKEAIGTKGMKVTMDISLPGRYLIYMPMSKHVGVSRQIEDHAERDRLKKILDTLKPPGGIIVRTEAEGVEEKSLKREVKYLSRLWENIKKRSLKINKGLVHRELGLTFQVVRDILSEDVEAFLLDNKQEYEDVRGFVDMVAPELAERVRYYDSKTPIFDAFNIEKELEKLRSSRIDLPSGGFLVIQEAESLCAVDVNTGKFTGSTNQEETVTVTNIEAARETARQLRLRNIGGIVVIDFIDMRRRRNREKVLEVLVQASKSDHAKIKILPITRLGLVEMTRERRRESLQSMLCEPCMECNASGWVLSKESMFLKIRKEILNVTKGRSEGTLNVYLHSDVAPYFRENSTRLQKYIHRDAKIHDDDALPWENYRIVLE